MAIDYGYSVMKGFIDSPLKIIIVRIFKQIEEAHIRQANARVLLSLYQL